MRGLTLGLHRALTPLLALLGLLLMHGGIGPAVACTGMSDSSMTVRMEMTQGMPATAPPTVVWTGMPIAKPPVAGHHGDMCLSTLTEKGGLSHAAPPQPVAVLREPPTTSRNLAVTRATGREPPAPDLVSVLCVIRR